MDKMEKEKVKELLKLIKSGSFAKLDIKKLKGFSDIFRIRKSNIRIIYKKEAGNFFIIKIEKRNNKTYKI